MEDRTTKELIETLGNDVDRCHQELIHAIDEGTTDSNGNVDADYGYQARQLVRAIFAFIEAVTFSAKVEAAEYCLDHNRDLTDAERFFATDTDYILNDKGRVVERPAHIRLCDNVRFAFALQEKALGLKEPFDSSCAWWGCFKAAVKIRDRLTHPKMPDDVDISGDEIMTVLRAFDGFKQQLLKYGEQRRLDSPIPSHGLPDCAPPNPAFQRGGPGSPPVGKKR